MTVYVDDMHLPATVGRLKARWSHLMADNRAELIKFARQIGLRDSWIQDKPSGVHYDVTDSKRLQAIQSGAVPVGCRSDEWMRVAAQARAQYRQLIAANRPPVRTHRPQHHAEGTQIKTQEARR